MSKLEDYKIQIKQILDAFKIESTEGVVNSIAAFVVNEALEAKREGKRANVIVPNDRFNEMFEDICENYCTWPKDATSDATLKLHCQECPMNNIHIDEYWERKEK